MAIDPESPDPASVYLRQSAVRLARLCRKHFRIDGDPDHLRVREEVGDRDVLAFLTEYGASIRPVGLSPNKTIPSDTTSLRTFLWTTPIADSVLNDVVRLSLYTDQIVLVDPFSRHLSGRPYQPGKAGPFAEPTMWVQTFVNWALMVCALEPWVQAGLVVLIPEPQNFLQGLPDFAAIASNAYGSGLFSGREADGLQDMLEAAALTAGDPAELGSIVRLILPDLNDSERAEIEADLRSYQDANPTRYKPSNPEHASLITSGGGQNVFEACWIADTLGGRVRELLEKRDGVGSSAPID